MKFKIVNIILIIIFLNILYNLSFSDIVDQIYAERNFQTGITRFNFRQYQAAINYFNKALSYDPYHYKARYYLAYAYLNSGYTRNAIEEWENLIKLGGGNPSLKHKLNDLYFRLSIDKNYDITTPYIFLKFYDGIKEGMHKIIRPSFIIYDETKDSFLISSVKTKYITEIDGNGNVIRQFGRIFGDYTEFKFPSGIAIKNNKIFAVDYKTATIYIFDREGKLLKKINLKGNSISNISGPMGIAISDDNYLFIVDNGNDRIQKYDIDGNWIQPIGNDILNRPTDIVIDGNFLYVSDSGNKRIIKFDIYGNLIEYIGDNILIEPRGIYLKNNNLYIIDSQKGLFIYNIINKEIEKFTIDDGKFKKPFDIVLDNNNLIYITDFNSQNIGIFTPLQSYYQNISVQCSQIWLNNYPNNFIHVRVWDKKGNPIYNLTEDNFSIYEEGTLVPLPRVGATYSYRNKIYFKIIIDKSVKMKYYNDILLENLSTLFDKMTGDDWIDIIVLNDNIQSTGKIKANKLYSLDYIKNIEYSGNTPYNFDMAIYDSTTELMNINRNKAIIIFTYGDISYETFKTLSPDVIYTYAKQNAIPIYIIDYNNTRNFIFDKICSESFGKYYTIKNISQILNLYNEIKDSKPLEYIISYEGLNLKRLKNYWVNLTIKVKYKEMIGIEETGYYVPKFSSGILNLGKKEENEIEKEIMKKFK